MKSMKVYGQHDYGDDYDIVDHFKCKNLQRITVVHLLGALIPFHRSTRRASNSCL